MARVKFRLMDELGKAPDVSGFIAVHPDGIYVYVEDERGRAAQGPEAAVQLYGGKLDVSVFADPDRDEPTHVVTLRKYGPKEWRPRRR